MVMQGSELRTLRRQLGWSQGELARRIGMSLGFVGEMERGEKAIETATEARLRAALSMDRAEQEQDGTRVELFALTASEADALKDLLNKKRDVLMMAANRHLQKNEIDRQEALAIEAGRLGRIYDRLTLAFE